MADFEFRTEQRAPVVRAMIRESVSRASTGVLFLTGELANQAALIAEDVAAAEPRTQWLIVCAVGVLSSKGEIEADSGAVGLRFPVRAAIVLEQRGDRYFAASLRSAMNQTSGSTGCILVRGDNPDDEWLSEVQSAHNDLETRIFGGGALPGSPIFQVSAGEVRSGGVAGLIWPGRTSSRIAASSACRLLSPVGEVTKAEGPLIQQLDGGSALSRLGEATVGLEDGSLVLLALAAGRRPLDPSGRTLALWPIVGVDPTQESILVQEELPVGSRVAFAVRDPHGARSDFEAHLRALKTSMAGAAPGFGLYVSCAGRGQALYKSPDVDTRLIATHFPQMPFVGMHSTFELAPLGTRLTPQVYAGVVGVFSLPS